MKMISRIILSFGLLGVGAGCAHPQATVQPILNCAAASSGGPYQVLNTATPDPNSNYLDQPPPGAWCYAVQTKDGSGISQPSNVVMVTTTASLTHASLTWKAPVGYTCVNGCTYLVSRLAATSVIPGAPAVDTPTTQAQVDIRSPIGLTARGR